MVNKQQLIEFLGDRPRRVHFVGIGGVGMSGLARILVAAGAPRDRVGRVAQRRDEGVAEVGRQNLHSGHAAEHVGDDTELVVYTSAVNGENVELQAAAELKIPRVRRGLLLSALMNHRNNIAVAGTHGKTTTTAMIAYVLTRSDSAPSYCVGAHVPVLGANAQIGGGKYFVAEADESDGTLIGFSPEYAVCLNIEPEHLDHYGSMDKLRRDVRIVFLQHAQDGVLLRRLPELRGDWPGEVRDRHHVRPFPARPITARSTSNRRHAAPGSRSPAATSRSA